MNKMTERGNIKSIWKFLTQKTVNRSDIGELNLVCAVINIDNGLLLRNHADFNVVKIVSESFQTLNKPVFGNEPCLRRVSVGIPTTMQVKRYFNGYSSAVAACQNKTHTAIEPVRQNGDKRTTLRRCVYNEQC